MIDLLSKLAGTIMDRISFKAEITATTTRNTFWFCVRTDSFPSKSFPNLLELATIFLR
jgi:hypothetical protein